MTNIVDIWNKSNELFLKWVDEGAHQFIPKGVLFKQGSKSLFVSLGMYSDRRMGIWFENKKDFTCFSGFSDPSRTKYTHPTVEEFMDLFYDLDEKNKILLCLLLVNPLEVKEE